METFLTSFDTLDETLAPLLAKSLPDTLVNLTPLQKAKANVMLSYIINDLVWMFLKVQGHDAANHPVMAQLKRVQGYFEKIKEAELGKAKPTQRLDRAAANRFISSAVKSAKTAEQIEADRSHGKHSRFSSLARPDAPQATTSEDVAVVEQLSQPPSKKKRPAMDPFEGYESKAAEAKPADPMPKKKKSKKLKMKATE
ncbi:uncharacterized protein L969DRAFT_43341 [Mixia osmundae IAM 14324]|uniref:Exosome complex protein n=1 Tax=Mixia osmundae (strain CBS 9802 / IAM 14324 / JCM 22182 / KY 12970) TaxID=764103 RepID=G7EAJ4_MIXOS|nr:uncharacterized protein L969DRAFT_43341 [Mixia osmundae IAM 14324]KEI42344.1 hypothetical protein L969DRAFT_43341 [Mixia osmundae IAM 14324]GAA99854.1 hypothetical protein E5Q_06557 [Mixia osmundae IAM 14324]